MDRSRVDIGDSTVVCGCLLISCGTRNATIPASDLSVDGSSPSPAPAPGPGCPKSASKAGGSCPSAKMECKYIRIYCPDNPMGPAYFYERDIYRCKGGAWAYEGQDCYDCCRWSADGGLSHACPAAAKKGGACAAALDTLCTSERQADQELLGHPRAEIGAGHDLPPLFGRLWSAVLAGSQ